MIKRSILAGAVALAATCALGGASSSIAATTSLGGPVSVENSSPMIEVAQSRHFKKRYYNRSRGWNGGQRYRYRHGSYRHYHGGYWYSSPWWHHSGPTIALGFGPAYGGYGYNGYNAYSGGGDHVQWCYDHYRSYDARSNTFMGYDGYRHECNSPYAY